jgi:cupin 2 domain-containing protein
VSVPLNLLRDLPDMMAREVVEVLVARPGVRVERIVSLGQASPEGFWYDQAEGEWVLLLAGSARLRFADEPEARMLVPGDALDIAPHRRHRVDWTDPATPTVWLPCSTVEAPAHRTASAGSAAGAGDEPAA